MPRARLPRSRAARVLLAAVALGVALLLVVGLDITLALRRVERITVPLKGSGGGTTILLVGSDGRARLDPVEQSRYRDTNQATGERADVMILVRIGTDGSQRVVSVPRDLWVGTERHAPNRLGMWLVEGPGKLVEAYCADLHVGLDHIVVVDFAAVESLVEAAGGVEVSTSTPVRDVKAALDLSTAGRHHLDGVAALAWIRSRHLEELREGRWTPAAVPDQRTAHLTAVLAQVSDALTTNPVAAQRALWAVPPHTRTDPGVGALTWIRLARTLAAATKPGSLAQVPARHTEGAVPVAFPTTETAPALEPFRSSTCS